MRGLTAVLGSSDPKSTLAQRRGRVSRPDSLAELVPGGKVTGVALLPGPRPKFRTQFMIFAGATWLTKNHVGARVIACLGHFFAPAQKPPPTTTERRLNDN
jgi:hypothetical protein